MHPRNNAIDSRCDRKMKSTKGENGDWRFCFMCDDELIGRALVASNNDEEGLQHVSSRVWMCVGARFILAAIETSRSQSNLSAKFCTT